MRIKVLPCLIGADKNIADKIMSMQENLNLDHCCIQANILELEKAAQLSDKITLWPPKSMLPLTYF
jgi:hypothetical protein